MVSYLLIVALIVIGIAIIGFFLWGLKKAIFLALNSVIGFFALYAIKTFMIKTLVINIWSVLLTAIFGLLGLIAVIIAHLAHIAF